VGIRVSGQFCIRDGEAREGRMVRPGSKFPVKPENKSPVHPDSAPDALQKQHSQWSQNTQRIRQTCEV